MNSNWPNNFGLQEQGMFFSELGEITADERTPNHPLVAVPPPLTLALALTQGQSQHTTPVFLDHEQYFMDHLDDRLYMSSQVNTPVEGSVKSRVNGIDSGSTDPSTSSRDFDHLFTLPDDMMLSEYGLITLPEQKQKLLQLHNHGLQHPNPHQTQNQNQNQSQNHVLMAQRSGDFLSSPLDQMSHFKLHQTRNKVDIHAGRHPQVRHRSEASSTAFPPSASVYPPQTPSMLANNKAIQASNVQPMALPILPSQNEKLYNELHLFYKNRSNGGGGHSDLQLMHSMTSHQPQNQHVRPDAIFTPLVSPAVTPLESQVNLNSGSSSGNFAAPVLASFEPLTLPALAAQQDKRRTLSSLYGPNEMDAKTSGSLKRKTPHGTPVLQSNTSKQSPGINKSGSKVPPLTVFEKLPEASVDSKSSSGASTPMLPPQGKKIDIKLEQPTMMGFTMGRLAELQSSSKNNSNTSTPSSASRPAHYKRVLYNSKLLPKSLLSSETLPALSAHDGTEKDSDLNLAGNLLIGEASVDDPNKLRKTVLLSSSKLHPTKKASHKVAEQGRRNRMNVAIHELASLIPKYYHDEVSIPSKATTVELASKYIKNLLKELEEAKAK